MWLPKTESQTLTLHLTALLSFSFLQVDFVIVPSPHELLSLSDVPHHIPPEVSQ